MKSQKTPTRARDPHDVQAVLDACRSLVAIAAVSVDAVAEQVDLVELRVLVVLAGRGPSSLKELCDLTRLHPSRASRACARLEDKQFVSRAQDESDRRLLQIELTDRGEEVVRTVRDQRRAAIEPVLAAMSHPARSELLRSLRAFADAAGETVAVSGAALGWAY